MYFNDINIGFYIIAIILGLITGEVVNWVQIRIPEHKKLVFQGGLKDYKKQFSPNYFFMILTAVIYVGLLYKFGIKESFIENLSLIKYVIITPILLCIFMIDYKLKIIPNRLVLTTFEIGLVFAFISGISNIAIAIDLLLGMFAGAGIFLLITLLGGMLYGKDAMGLGDVKLMGALGLAFGLQNIINIAILSFLIAAVVSIILIILRIKKLDEYIAFGPFIIIATFLVIFIPYTTITNVLLNIFTLGMY